jgi:hypothetical protein
LRTPRALALANKRGIWGGLTLGCAVVGIAMHRIWLPLAVSNGLFAVLTYAIVWFGLGQVTKH